MANPYPIRGTKAEMEFIKVIRSLSRQHALWRVWSDAMSMMALSISNAVDLKRKGKREEQYLSIVKVYSSTDLNDFAKLFALTVQALEEDPEQDFLGKMYMHLELGNKWKGQFFTPFNVCRMMAEMQLHDAQELIDKRGWMSICDNCVGAGGMLIASATACRKHNVNYHDHVLFVGQDIDPVVAMMAYIQLSLLGCPGYIKVGNSLSEPMTGSVLFGEDSESMWFTPFYYKDTWHYRRAFAMIDHLFKSDPNAFRGDISLNEDKQPCVALDGINRKFFFFFEEAV